jgi:peptide/nickel transport system substrate-binding protein
VSDLSILDPVVTGKTQPQMVEGHAVEEDGLTWTLKLRDDLRFHDNEPVPAPDVVASVRRFAPRVIFANALMAATDELSAPDDRTVRFRLKRPSMNRAAARPFAEAASGCLRPRRRPSINRPGAVYAERGYSSPVRLANDESLPGPPVARRSKDLPICCAERLGPATSVVRKGSDRSAGRPRFEENHEWRR